jgi:hypothetical protein
LESSNLRQLGYLFVKYEICKVNGRYASKSADMLSNNEQLITLNRVHAMLVGNTMQEMFDKNSGMSGEDKAHYACNMLSRFMGIPAKDACDYISILLQADALLLNEDRHLDNIAIIKNDTGFRFTPIFDFDCALFSCAEDLSEQSIKRYLQIKPALPFERSHDDQIKIAHAISDKRLSISDKISMEDVWEPAFNIGKREICRYLTGGYCDKQV